MRPLYLIVAASLLLATTQASAIGLLLPTDQSLKPLTVKYHRVTATIKNGTAVTSVKQSFENHTRRVLEGTFYFPLPNGATISDFALYMNGKRVQGSVLERKQARQIYESIVRRMRDPGLIEYLNRRLFKARIYPIPANGEMKVDIAFTQVLPFNDGLYEYSYPMRTPRGVATALREFTLLTTISSNVPIKTVYSPSHRIYVKKKGDHLAHASFEQSAVTFDKDFTLYYTVSKKAIGLNLLTYRPDGENGYYLLMASPKSKLRDTEIIGKGVVFVIDTSGSMSGEKMKRAKAALKYCLNRLHAKDWFNVIRFSSDVERFEKWQVPANAHNKKRALKFVESMEAGGATAFDDALRSALKVKGKRPHIIMFLTDGRPTIGETTEKQIIANATKANDVKASVFFFGIGDDINTHLMDKIAGDNRGFSTYLKPNQDIERRVAAFYNKISYPVMTNLRLSFGSTKSYAMVPGKLPDLFKGSQLIIFGRYRNSGHSSISLSGSVGGEKKTFTFEGAFPKSNDKNGFIAKLWAHRQIGYLLDEIRLKGVNPELKKEVIQLAKRFSIVTPYTSYLVVEPKDRIRLGMTTPPRRNIQFKRRRSGDGTLSRFSPLSKRPGNHGHYRSPTKINEAPSPTPRRDSDDLRGFDLKPKSGEKSVRTARKLRRLKQSQYLRPETTPTRAKYVAGKRFRIVNGVWIDSRYRSSMTTLKIAYLSDAYFNLVSAIPRLASYLKLGSRVIVVWKQTAIVIDSSGERTLSVDQIRARIR